jgi:hypothetical protein
VVPLLTTTSTVMCPHAGQAQLFTSNTVSVVDGAPVLLEIDVHPVVGCTFAPGGVYTPCLLIRWVLGATMTKINGIPVLLQTSVGVCYNAMQAPQGVALIVQTQQRVRGI